MYIPIYTYLSETKYIYIIVIFIMLKYLTRYIFYENPKFNCIQNVVEQLVNLLLTFLKNIFLSLGCLEYSNII